LKAAKTLKHLRSIYIQEMSATVQGDKIVSYRVDAKVSFLLE
jgi:dodecin